MLAVLLQSHCSLEAVFGRLNTLRSGDFIIDER